MLWPLKWTNTRFWLCIVEPLVKSFSCLWIVELMVTFLHFSLQMRTLEDLLVSSCDPAHANGWNPVGLGTKIYLPTLKVI